MTPIHRIAQIFAPVRKPYQAEQLNALPANERKKVFGTEADLFLQMLALAAYASHTQERTHGISYLKIKTSSIRR